MRDQEHGATGPEAADHLPYQIERPLVEHRERFIQDQHVGLKDERTDQAHDHLFSCGEASPLLADLRR